MVNESLPHEQIQTQKFDENCFFSGVEALKANGVFTVYRAVEYKKIQSFRTKAPLTQSVKTLEVLLNRSVVSAF